MFLRILAACILLTSTAVPSFSGPYTGQPSAVDSGASYHRHGRSERIGLPPELKLLWRQEEKPHLKAMPKQERHGWLRAHWAAMSDKERKTKTSELEANWKSLPPTVKTAMLEKIRTRHEARRMRHEERRQDRAGGHNQEQQG